MLRSRMRYLVSIYIYAPCLHVGEEVLVSRVPAGLQARFGHDAAVLPVDLEHAPERGLVGVRQDVVDVAVGRVDAADGAAREGVGHHDDEDLQRRDGGLVLAVAHDSQVHPGGGRQTWSAGVTGLEQTKPGKQTTVFYF